MAQPIGSNFVLCGNDPSNPNTYRRILAQYIDASIAPPVAQDLSAVLSNGNTMSAGQFIDASGLGTTAIDATGSNIISQNLSVEKLIPLGTPIISNISLEGGLTVESGGNYGIQFSDDIRISKGLTDFIYSSGNDLHLSPTGEILATGKDLTVSKLTYTTLDPAIPTPDLTAVLTVNDDAGGLDITNLNNLSANSISVNTSGQVDFSSEIRLSKATTDFIYTDIADGLYLNPLGDTYVGTLHYNTLDPVPPAPINYQTFYANLGDNLQNAIINLSGSTRKALYLSTGSWIYTGTLAFDNLDTTAICGQPSFSPLTRITASAGFQLQGASSTRNQFQWLAFGGSFDLIGTQGRHKWYKCEFLQGLTISGTTTNFLEFDSCDFSGGALTIPITFGGVVFFKNCNFTGTTAFNLNNPMSTQVVFLACIGVNPVNTAKATIQSWNEINGTTRADAYDVNATNVKSVNGQFTDGTTTINIDPLTTKGIEITNAVGQAKIKLVDTDGDEIEIQNTEIDVFHSSASSSQSNRYYQLKDANGNEVDWYIGGTTPTHVASKGSIFVETSTPSIYQSNGGGVWNTVGGGGGSSIVGSYSVPCISKSTVPTGLTLSTTPQTVLFDTDIINTPASWIGSPVSGVWTVPFNAVYTLSASLSITGTGTNSARAVWYINGSASGARDIEIVQTGDNWLYVQYTTQLNVGDLVDLRMSSGTNTPTATFNATDSYALWNAYRLDPLTISSTIYIPKLSKWRGSANYALSPVGVPNQILFGNPDILIPSASWVNATTGQMEVLENGVYSVFASLRFATEAVDKTVNARIYVNGSQVGRDVEYFPASFTNPIITVSGVFQLTAGDIITIWADTIQGSGGSIVNGTDESTYYYVEKISA
jgi:hypothetical protein